MECDLNENAHFFIIYLIVEKKEGDKFKLNKRMGESSPFK